MTTEPTTFIPAFLLKRVLPEPTPWVAKPVYVPEPQEERVPIGSKKPRGAKDGG